MAKIYGLFGSMTGKVADVVMSVRNGEQIARKYQPMVSNPSTQAQIETRAKLKLMSQLSAVMAPVIAIPRRGNVSSRNLFVKTNFGSATYSNNQADITLSAVKLTKSVVGMPQITSSRTTTEIQVYIPDSENPASLDVSRVVYAMFVKEADGTLRYGGSKVANTAGTPANWEVRFPIDARECVFYAYGVRDNTEFARTTFGDMQTITAETVAKLIVSRNLLEADVTLTETRASLLAADSE